MATSIVDFLRYCYRPHFALFVFELNVEHSQLSGWQKVNEDQIQDEKVIIEGERSESELVEERFGKLSFNQRNKKEMCLVQ